MTLAEDIKFDVSPKNGSLAGALISFFSAVGMFVIIPYVLFMSVSGDLGVINGDLADGAWDRVMDLIKYAAPLVLLSIPIGFYRAGSYARIPFKIMFALYLGSWIWIASGGGIFSVSFDAAAVMGAASSIFVEIDIKYVIYVMIMICFAMMFLAFSEFGGNRKKYLEAIEKKKDTMSKRKARRLSK